MSKLLTRILLTKLCAIFAIVCVTSCGSTRVVFIQESSDVVRLGPDVKGHVYFYRDGKWVLSKNKVPLPEGWFAGQLESAGERE